MTRKEKIMKLTSEWTDFDFECRGDFANAILKITSPDITDEDIVKWANSKEEIIDVMPETLKLHITKKIECRIEGAKAFRDGEIKHIEK